MLAAAVLACRLVSSVCQYADPLVLHALPFNLYAHPSLASVLQDASHTREAEASSTGTSAKLKLSAKRTIQPSLAPGGSRSSL